MKKMVQIWKWLDLFTKYDTKYADAHTAYGALIAGSAVCDGYAISYDILLHRAGVDALCILGKVPGNRKHAWNWVRIGVEWFASDSTNTPRGKLIKAINNEYHKEYYKYDIELGNRYFDFGLRISSIDYKYNQYQLKDIPLYQQQEATDSGRIGSNLRWTLVNGTLNITGN